MTIKPQNLLRSLLVIPYVAWGIALLFALLVDRFNVDPDSTNVLLNILVGVSTFYTIGIILWGIPFTILAVALLLWSIKKSAATIFKGFLFSPFLLSMLMAIEIALVTFWPPQAISLDSLRQALSYLLVAVIPTLMFGYGFVGAGILLYQAVRRLNLLRTETKSIQVLEAK